MKRGKRVLFLLAVVILLTACGRKSDTAVTTGEIAVPEMSSGDLLVNSIEYLLEDDAETGEEVQGQEVSADTAKDEGEAVDSVAFVVYYSNGSCDGLDSRMEKAEQLTADVLVAALARHNIVSLDTKVLSFREEEKEEGKVLYLDLSAEMDNYLDTMTGKAKDIIINSIASTFLENYHADIIYIQIAGKPLYQSETLEKAQDGKEV